MSFAEVEPSLALDAAVLASVGAGHKRLCSIFRDVATRLPIEKREIKASLQRLRRAKRVKCDLVSGHWSVVSPFRLEWRLARGVWKAHCHGFDLGAYKLSDGWHVEIDRVASTITNIIRHGPLESADDAKLWAENRFRKHAAYEAKRMARILRDMGGEK